MKPNIIIFPTLKASKLYKSENKLWLEPNIEVEPKTWINNNGYAEPMHLYIISNDEIKEDDLIISIIKGDIGQSKYNTKNSEVWKKIISSTDKSITPNSMIEDSFINEYIKSYNQDKTIT